MPEELPHYLRSIRRRAGLSQRDLAALLGVARGTKVSRYEQHARQPQLETALAYEAIFKVPVRELFAGMFQEVESAVARRAALLLNQLETEPTEESRRRTMVLQALISESHVETVWPGENPRH